MDCNVLILAGGFGERLWPVSNKEFPKQFMKLENGLSFFQQSLERAYSLKPKGKIYIVTRQDILATTMEQCSSYANTLLKTESNVFKDKLLVIAEPCQKHTAPPIMLVCRYIQSLEETELPLLILTSDHIINPFNAFNKDVKKAVAQANNGSFVCFAIPPTEPSSSFGYMQVSKESVGSIYKIDFFKEKPDIKTAKTYLKKGNFLWNSGMFCVLPSLFITELELHTPEVSTAFTVIKAKDKPSIQTENGIQYLNAWNYMVKTYKKSIAISIDHAVAEKSKKAFAVRAGFKWKDIGTWDSFASLFKNNYEGNAIVGKVVQTNSSNCFVYTDTPVVLCGIENLIISIKNGKVLIMKKGTSESIKDTTKKLKES